MIDRCEIIQDLLPLYVDSACSASSTVMIEEHLDNCPKCKSLYEKLCSDSGGEILKAEMTEVVAKHEKQIKKKRILAITKSVAITSIVALLVIGLLIWRVWPNSSSAIIPVDRMEITSFSASAVVQRLENGQTLTNFYRTENTECCSDPSEIMDILAASSYQQDFRNLLPWDLDSVGADKNYDGRTVMLMLYTGSHNEDYVYIQFLSSSIIAISVGNEEDFRIYHPTNHDIFDTLMEYLEMNGIKE